MNRPFPFDERTEAVYTDPYWHAHTGVGQLAQVLFRKAAELFLMLAFYGDGSGEHRKGTFVVAGYLANTTDWFQIESDWCCALKQPPTIQYFKARECIRHQGDFSGEFKGWTEQAVEEKRRLLAEVIRRHNHRLVALSSTLRWDEYHSVIGDDAVKQVFYSPYLFCFYGVINSATEHANTHFPDHPGRIAFVLDTESLKL